MPVYNIGGTPTRITGTGVTVVTSGSGPITVVAALAATLLTGPELTLWAGVTATSSGTSQLMSPVALTTGVTLFIPAASPGGLTARVTGSATPDVTLYWTNG